MLITIPLVYVKETSNVKGILMNGVVAQDDHVKPLKAGDLLGFLKKKSLIN